MFNHSIMKIMLMLHIAENCHQNGFEMMNRSLIKLQEDLLVVISFSYFFMRIYKFDNFMLMVNVLTSMEKLQLVSNNETHILIKQIVETTYAIKTQLDNINCLYNSDERSRRERH